ncbi:toll/interleukin-1 receptor domain-containing adapter protein [Dromaius novaehollandiae]|uniref:toll/interleukin-1 receptor domain-containing adapter protein n=1 Tax=Dromaius novaehollandiae TaxID=8790 RepID=UPI003120018A
MRRTALLRLPRPRPRPSVPARCHLPLRPESQPQRRVRIAPGGSGGGADGRLLPVAARRTGFQWALMAGWFQRLLRRRKPSPGSMESGLSAAARHPPPSSSSSSSSSPSSSEARRLAASPCSVDISSASSARWAKSYDACICHSAGDLPFAEELAAYLEGQPEGLRCFLQPRDAAPGAAVPTELCEAVRGSHCWVLLITPAFLRDPWCKYQLHQALAEAPAADGRAIPVLKDVGRGEYPAELRSLYYIPAARRDTAFRQVRDAVLRYLRELCRGSAGRPE